MKHLGYEEQITKPVFHNYDELRNILQDGFSIYEDFKEALLNLENLA